MERALPLDLVTPDRDNQIAELRAVLVAGFDDADAALITRALAWMEVRAAKLTLRNGEVLSAHAIATVAILREFRVDAECLAASMLAYFVESDAAVSALREKFGARVTELAQGVARMAMIEGVSARAAGTGAQAAQHASWNRMPTGVSRPSSTKSVQAASNT